MKPVTVDVEIDAPRAVVWSLITDIENAASTISAIEEVEVLDRPDIGIRGLRWRETRVMYGKRASETMRVTEVDEGSRYATEARSHGSIYRTDVRVSEMNGGSRLTMEFSAQPVSVLARAMTLVFGRLIARSVSSALRQDLMDLKTGAESRARSQSTPRS